jgi:predicted CoA-binding protein
MNEPETIERILKEAKTIAVVGLSANPEKTSHHVAQFLQSKGYRIIPVNPTVQGEILGEKAYPNLQSIPEPFDVADVFRRAEDIPDVVDDAIAAGAKTLWIQLGIVNEEAAARAERAGMTVVMDRCTMAEHRGRWGQTVTGTDEDTRSSL